MTYYDSYESPLLTFTNAKDAEGYLGQAEEMTALNLRTKAMDRAIREGTGFDVLLDMLEEHGQDPCEYVDDVARRVSQIITYQLIPDDLEYWQRKHK